MADKDKIVQLLEKKLEGTDVFVVDVFIKQGNRILVFLDSDTAVNIDTCASVSKYLESNMKTEIEDFNLEVSSAGVTQPLKLIRQYTKNIGRQIQINTIENEKISGKLAAVKADSVVVESDKAHKEEKIITIQFNLIKEAKILVSFK